MTPDNWGPVTWYTLHFIALAYSDSPTTENIYEYKSFFENFWKVLPCYKCAVNYKRHLQELPLTEQFLVNSDTLFAWTVSLHNIVNKENGKPLMSIEDAKKKYTDSAFARKVAAEKYYHDQQANAIIPSTPHDKFDPMSAVIGMVCGIVAGVALVWLYSKLMTKRRG